METWVEVNYKPHIPLVLNNTLISYLIILIISVIYNQSADMEMDVYPSAFAELGTEQHLSNMDVTSEDGETLAMARELRATGGTYSLYLLILIYHILINIKHF